MSDRPSEPSDFDAMELRAPSPEYGAFLLEKEKRKLKEPLEDITDTRLLRAIQNTGYQRKGLTGTETSSTRQSPAQPHTADTPAAIVGLDVNLDTVSNALALHSSVATSSDRPTISLTTRTSKNGHAAKYVKISQSSKSVGSPGDFSKSTAEQTSKTHPSTPDIFSEATPYFEGNVSPVIQREVPQTSASFSRLPVPEDIRALADLIKSLNRNAQGYPTRAALKKGEELRGEISRKSGAIKLKGSKLRPWIGDERLFREDEWQYLTGNH